MYLLKIDVECLLHHVSLVSPGAIELTLTLNLPSSLEMTFDNTSIEDLLDA